MGGGYGNCLHMKLAAKGGEKHKEGAEGTVWGARGWTPTPAQLRAACGHSVLRAAPPQGRVARDTCVLGWLGDSPPVKTQAIPHPNLPSRQ